jgi:serine/threonine-protein kinase
VQTAALKVISIPQSQRDADALRSTGMDEASIGEYYKELAAQLMNELRTMEQLKGHTNIVSYEDHEIRKKENGFGWDLYIRMELLTPLSKYMLAHNMEREEIIRLGIDLCRALERCESLNIIHRDIKPDNIFISKMGDGKLGDFGIARTVERTMSGLSQKGTYGYMAPEIYLGQPYGKTVDIYSLGLVLYKLLNYNRGPFLPAYPNPIRFQDQEQALVRRIRGEQLPAPVQADRRLAEVVLKACSADPGRRYATAGEMRRALQAMVANRPGASVSEESRDPMHQVNRKTTRLVSQVSGSELFPEQAIRRQEEGASLANREILPAAAVQREMQSRAYAGLKSKGKNKKKRHKIWLALLITAIAAPVVIGIFWSGEEAQDNKTILEGMNASQKDFISLEINEDRFYLRENESRTIYITAKCTDEDADFYVEKDYDPEYFEVEWGEWDGDILPVTIKLIKSGNYVKQIVFSAYRYEEDPFLQRRTVFVTSS